MCRFFQRRSLASGITKCNKNGGFRHTSRLFPELMRLLASLSTATTCCGQAHHRHETRRPLYAPGERVLFKFLDMGFRELPFRNCLKSLDRPQNRALRAYETEQKHH